MNEKILIVEDDLIVLEGLKLNLEMEGYNIFTANSGKEALKILEKESIDLILSDIVMDEFSGLDLLFHVKKGYPEIIVILITGYGSLDTVIQALRNGAYDYLLKPCSDEELKIRIKRGLERRKMERIVKEKCRQDALLELVSGFADTLNNLVAGISGSYEILKTCLNNKICPEALTSFRDIDRNINKTARIIDNLCMMINSLTESEISAFDIREAFQNVKAHFDFNLIDFNIPAKLPWIYGNDRLSTAFINIVQNSIEASQKEQPVKITARTESTAEFIEVIFEDRGCGITEDDLTKIFIPFFTKKEKTNAGLGLWVAYQTISYFRGTISVSSEKGVGTTVTVRLPIYRTQKFEQV